MLKLISIKLPYQFLELPHDQLALIINICVPSIVSIICLCEYFTYGLICSEKPAYFSSIIVSRLSVKEDDFLSSGFEVSKFVLKFVALIGAFVSVYVFYLMYREERRLNRMVQQNAANLPTHLQPNDQSSGRNKGNASKLSIGISGIILVVSCIGIFVEKRSLSVFFVSMLIALYGSIPFLFVMCSENVCSYVVRKFFVKLTN